MGEKSRIVLVTGGSRGIGRATAEVLARAGYRVAIGYYHSRKEALELANRLRAEGCDAAAVGGDISDSGQVSELFRQVREQFGPVEILINNAGVAQQKLFTLLTDDDWERMFAVDVRGVFLCCREALPEMIRRHWGRIINISSVWGITGASCEVHYSAAKAAVIGLTRALAKEVGPSGITVNCVAPGVVDTQMNESLSRETLDALREETPLGVIGTPQNIADAVAFLASPAADFITGQVLSPNGGFVI